MSRNFFSISREFGSGGRTVGKLVAQQLGVAYYDKELVKQVALKTGFNERFIEQVGEDSREKSWLGHLFSAPGTPGIMNGMSADDFLWTIQYQVILDLADKGPCVIVGRCSDYILRDRPDAFHVFVHASVPVRAERIVRLYGESENSPEKRLGDKDKRRRLHYKHYTGQEWGMSQNYHLSLDSGVLGIQRCVDLIVQLSQELD